LQKADVIDEKNESQTRWSPGLRGQPLLSTWGNIKYFFTHSDSSNFLQLGYTKISKIGDITVLKNNYYLPMGYTYTHYLPFEEFDKLDRFKKDLALLNYAVLEDTTTVSGFLPRYSPKDTILALNENTFGNDFYINNKNDFENKEDTPKSLYAKFREKLIEDTLKITSHGNDFINGTISLKQSKLLFLTIPYDKGWQAVVNGKKYPIIKSDIGFTALKLAAGNYTIELKYLPWYFTGVLWITLISNGLFILMVAISVFRKWKKNKMDKISNSLAQ
jgi:uncharacterized membrane protein YfhO